MKRKTYHVTPTGKNWRVIRAGAARAAGIFTRKTPAVACAKHLLRNVALGQVKVHRRDGRIQTEYTYGKDPRRSPG